MAADNRQGPAVWKILLGVLALGCALLVGFVAGLKMGDRGRRTRSVAEDPAVAAVDTAAVADSLAAVADSLAAPVEPPVPAAPQPSRQQIAQGVEYLASHNQWNRDEMEKIPSLQGLWDAVNTYQLEDIRRYNETLASTPLTAVVEGLEHTPKQGYYASKGDRTITLSTYIKRLR